MSAPVDWLTGERPPLPHRERTPLFDLIEAEVRTEWPEVDQDTQPSMAVQPPRRGEPTEVIPVVEEPTVPVSAAVPVGAVAAEVDVAAPDRWGLVRVGAARHRLGVDPVSERLELDQDALTKAHVAVEDEVIDRRDRRIFVLHANGVVVREADGQESSTMRMGTREALACGIRAYLEAVGGVS